MREFADGVHKVDVLINTNLLLPKLTDRVVTVSSIMHWMGYISLKDLNWESRRYLGQRLAYGQSKLTNLLFTGELQRRLRAVGTAQAGAGTAPLRALAAHPGYSHTNLQGHSGHKFGDAVMSLGTRLLATDADFGARQTLYAASQDLPGDTFTGPRFAFLGRTQQVGRSRLAKTRLLLPPCGSCPSSSPTPNFRSEELMR